MMVEMALEWAAVHQDLVIPVLIGGAVSFLASGVYYNRQGLTGTGIAITFFLLGLYCG